MAINDLPAAATRDPKDTAARWLVQAAAPGRRRFVAAAGLVSLETLFTMGGWAGLALVAQALFDHDSRLGGIGIGCMIGFGALSSLAGWSESKVRGTGWRAVAHQIRGQLAASLLPLGRRPRDPDPAPAALAMVELAQDVAAYHAQTIPQRLSAPLSMAAVFLATAAVQWPAAIVLLLSTALIPLNMRLAGLFAQDGADRQLVATQRLSAVILDSFRGMRTLRSLGAVQRRRDSLVVAAQQLNTTSMSVLRRAFLSGMIMDVVITFSIAANATYAGLALLGYVSVPAAPHLTLGGGLFVLLICPLYFAPLRATAAAYHERERATAAASAIVGMLADPDATGHKGLSSPLDIAVEINLVETTLRFDGDADNDAFTIERLTIQAGKWTAVTGASGAGKTTLLSLIAGKRVPSSGHVTWSTDTSIQAPELGACAWIGQQTVLLDGTVGDNVRLGRPDASDRDVDQAVAAAGLTDVVARLATGLNTRLGEGGWGLSTGEARRIAIARAFLRGARLWVLDEPSAHLDPDAEQQIITALRDATRGCTVVIATHSAPMAAAADTIVLIEDGTVRSMTAELAA
jgi:ATP-binding cassette subfamily C protein CydD